MKSAATMVSVNPEFMVVQPAPLSVERKTPPAVPAKSGDPLSDNKDETRLFLRPEFIAFQLLPLSVERDTPLNVPPAKRVVPTIVSALTSCGDRPSRVQFAPLSVEQSTP